MIGSIWNQNEPRWHWFELYGNDFESDFQIIWMFGGLDCFLPPVVWRWDVAETWHRIKVTGHGLLLMAVWWINGAGLDMKSALGWFDWLAVEWKTCEWMIGFSVIRIKPDLPCSLYWPARCIGGAARRSRPSWGFPRALPGFREGANLVAREGQDNPGPAKTPKGLIRSGLALWPLKRPPIG